MVVKAKMTPLNVREVGQNISLRNCDLVVLHVFRVNELDIAEHAKFFKQDSANQSVKITSC